jgi:hypothetical protein
MYVVECEAFINREQEAYEMSNGGRIYDILYFVAVNGSHVVSSMQEVSKVIDLLCEAGYVVNISRFS